MMSQGYDETSGMWHAMMCLCSTGCMRASNTDEDVRICYFQTQVEWILGLGFLVRRC